MSDAAILLGRDSPHAQPFVGHREATLDDAFAHHTGGCLSTETA